MIYTKELNEAGYTVQRAGCVFDCDSMEAFDGFLLVANNGEMCGLLRVAQSIELSHDLSGKEFSEDLYDSADEQGDDSVKVAKAICGSMESSPAFYDELISCTHWSHVDYCFVDEAHRGKGVGALFALAWMEAYAPEHFVTAIPELAEPKLVKYWQENAGFAPVSESEPDGAVYRASPNTGLERWFLYFSRAIDRHKNAIRAGKK